MAKAATQANNDANSDYSGWEKTALGNYNNDIGGYMSNVNATLAGGNPYQSKPYLQNQNIQTSGAMNAANDKATQQLRDTALRTGTNTAAVAGEVGANRLQGQRDLTNYNATRDTQNQDKWLAEQNQLRQQQLAGANSEASVYGTSTGGRDNSLNNLTSIQNSEDEDWTKLGTAAIGGTGTGLTAAFA